MPHLPRPILDRIGSWSDIAQARFFDLRTLVHDVAAAADIGPLDESLKWGQPAWRPCRPRTGSTLRADWSPAAPDRFDLFVDCKTDLAARVTEAFPRDFDSDGQRCLSVPLDRPLATDALWHLAFATLTYHRAKRLSTQ
ncbi:MAG: DUF1801 domain-containing protein [Pseudomonadota bacterium]